MTYVALIICILWILSLQVVLRSLLLYLPFALCVSYPKVDEDASFNYDKNPKIPCHVLDKNYKQALYELQKCEEEDFEDCETERLKVLKLNRDRSGCYNTEN